MLVTPTEILQSFPISWKDHRYTLSIELVEFTIVLRFKINDLQGLSLNDIVNKIKQLDKKEDSVRESIKDLVFHRLELLTRDQVALWETAQHIITDLANKAQMVKELLQADVQYMRYMLAPHAEAAKMAGWNKWLTLCEGYAEQL